MKYSLFVLLIFILISCKEVKHKEINNNLTLDGWFHKDFEKDSIVGISLNKAYTDILQNKEGQEVIVALIDTEIDINHEELKDFIWVNKNEIHNNNIDDDKNGYIDDINGWNYLGTKDGKNLVFTNYTHIKIIRMYDSIFKNKKITDEGIDTVKFKLYKQALAEYEDQKLEIADDYNYIEVIRKRLAASFKTTDSIFGTTDYSIKEMDSIYKKFKKEKKVQLRKNAYLVLEYTRLGYDRTFPNYYLKQTKEVESKSNNLLFDDRAYLGDKPNNLHFRNGDPRVNLTIDVTDHATEMAGVIAGNRNNNIGDGGINNNVKIMCLPIFGIFGEESEKDLALSIRYAVDNGAKIINISANRTLAIRNDWVEEALLYAEENEVLIVKAAGNFGINVDEVTTYPNDIISGRELNNFINVGMNYKKMNKKLITDWSNYGKNNVDLFAPGNRVKLPTSNNEYAIDMGTSISAAMVTGVSALVLSFYPDLSAKELKSIILDSSEKYDIKVKMANDSLVQLKDISKTGGILNAYNALKLAEKRKQQ